MDSRRFDFDAVFSDDYLYFYESTLGPEPTGQAVELIWTLLQLKPGMHVLDLACGHGRIANRLAERGCLVTGIDANSAFIDRARGEACVRGIQAEFMLGDMRTLPWTERFDCVVNWFTSFGYFEDDENRQILAQVYRALKFGGRLLMDLMNRERLLRALLPGQETTGSVVERDGNCLMDRIRYDVARGCVRTERITLRDGSLRRMQFTARLFTFPELRDWLLQAGFSSVKGLGDQGKLLQLDSQRMVVLAAK